LHTVRFPALRQSDAEAFDALLAETPDGGLVDYRLTQPKWWFLHHQITRGYLVHGSNEGAVDEFRVKAQDDAHGAPVEAVFASDDAIWPIYFATADRWGGRRGLINWCEHVGGGARYLFALEDEPSWVDGAVYALPRATFEPTPGSRELVSEVPVRPRLVLPVAPSDFPLRDRTIAFRRGESVRRVTLRHALRFSSRGRR
jgi:hypothetical protein